eukprot:Sdes_comp20534_c0_seq1m15207
MKVPICDRSKDVVEPMIKPQWWCNCKTMAQEAVDAVRNGELSIKPDLHEKTWFHWLEDCRDWCISRQLWWGHRIPAYLIIPKGKEGKVDATVESNWVSARSIEEAHQKVQTKFGYRKGTYSLEQDPDVLDTWFSSGIFPFSIFGWPDSSLELDMFYPGHLLETGHDILFFWVARMVMLGKKLMGRLPFPEILLHALVRDAHGRKMSKSLGNIVDPMDVICGITLEALNAQIRNSNLNPDEVEKAIEGQKADFPNGIPRCGTDALRFSLAAYAAPGRDINLDVNRIVGYRLFCNKIWNAVKFSFLHLGENFKPHPIEGVSGRESQVDQWMLSRVQYAITHVNENILKYDFVACTTALYNLWLYDLCDVYLEAIKPIFYGDISDPEIISAQNVCREVLYIVLDNALKLLHPFMPYLSEELHARLPKRNARYAPSLCVSPYPQTSSGQNLILESEMSYVQNVCRSIRSIRQQYNLPSKAKPDVFLVCHDKEVYTLCLNWTTTIMVLVGGSSVKVVYRQEIDPSKGCAMTSVCDKCDVYVVVKGLVNAELEVGRINEKISKLELILQKLNLAMEAQDYNTKVPVNVRKSNQEKLEATLGEVKNLEKARQMYSMM